MHFNHCFIFHFSVQYRYLNVECHVTLEEKMHYFKVSIFIFKEITCITMFSFSLSVPLCSYPFSDFFHSTVETHHNQWTRNKKGFLVKERKLCSYGAIQIYFMCNCQTGKYKLCLTSSLPPEKELKIRSSEREN